MAKIPYYNTLGMIPNIPDGLAPLYEALIEGKTIKEVVCMAGRINIDNPDKDFKLENVTATEYVVGFSTKERPNGSQEYFDYVLIEPVHGQRDAFYLNWVRSFKL